MQCKRTLDLDQKTKCCKWVYDIINEGNYQVSEKMNNKWSSSLGEQFSEEEWSQLFKISYKATLECRLQSIQYLMLHRAIVTNDSLYKWRIIEYNSCEMCNREVETIEHLYWECEQINRLWLDLWQILQRNVEGHNLCKRDILLGVKLEKNENLINHVIIIVKRYIDKCRYLQQRVQLTAVKTEIKTCYLLEKHIATCKIGKDPIENFNKKWQPIVDWLENNI